jgi:hypothetical protein
MTAGFGLWAESMSDADVRAALPALSAAGSGLGLMLPSGRLDDASFARLTREASDAGVPIRAWPLLPVELGYWISESNARHAAELLESVAKWTERPGGPALQGVSVDLEPDFEYSERLRHASRGRPDRLLGMLASHVRPDRLRAARDVLARGVRRVRSAGLWAHAVTFPVVLDQPEGTSLLEDAFDIPVSGIDWDEVSVMVYQTPIAQWVGTWLGPELVRSYATSAVARFGERAGLDLGIVGDAGVGVDPGLRYPSPDALWLDIRAALEAGIPSGRLRIYGLAGVNQHGGVGRWLSPRHVESTASRSDARAVEGFRNAIRAVEVALRVTRR